MVSAVAESSHGGGHGHEAGIPSVVWYQFLNFGILGAIIFFASHKKVKALFSQRSADFYRQAKEAEARKKALEEQKADLERRFAQLQSQKKQSLLTAEQEAKQFLNDEKARAQLEAAKLDKDSEELLRAEENKLIEKLRQETLEMSMSTAEEKMSILGTEDKAKLNKQFEKRLEGAQL